MNLRGKQVKRENLIKYVEEIAVTTNKIIAIVPTKINPETGYVIYYEIIYGN